MRWCFRLRHAALALALAFVWAPALAAGDPGAQAVVDLVRPLLLPPSPEFAPPDWSDLDRVRSIRWAPLPPTMTNRPSPDGNGFARPGQTQIAGRPAMVVATGARSMVYSYYVQNLQAPVAPDAIADGFRAAGFTVTPARCALNGQPAPRRWYRLSGPRNRPAFFYVGPLASGGQGYTLFLDNLPPMTQQEAALYTDQCGPARPGAAPSPTPTRIANGQTGVVAFIEAVLRPAGAAPSIPWGQVSGLPVVTWNKPPPMKMASPYDDGGKDLNPRLLEGRFKTPTTEMLAIATGDDRGATRFSLMDGGNLPRGAVFDQLARDGYSLTALRCGKVYTQQASAWYRIAGPGKQPAILYRKAATFSGRTEETYIVRTDNLMPPMEAGQSTPIGGRCP